MSAEEKPATYLLIDGLINAAMQREPMEGAYLNGLAATMRRHAPESAPHSGNYWQCQVCTQRIGYDTEQAAWPCPDVDNVLATLTEALRKADV